MDEPDQTVGGYRLGIAVDRDHVAGALVDADGRVVAVTEQWMAKQPSLPAVLIAVLDLLVARMATVGATAVHVDRVMFAVSQVDGMAVFPDADSAQWWPWVGEVGPVAVVRLGAATTAVPPLALWPPDIRSRVALADVCVAGGAMLDGSDFEPLDVDGLAAFARGVVGRATAVAVTSVFSTVTPRHELAAAAVIAEVLGEDVPVVMSHECGGLGLLERENATVLQAALIGPASQGAAWLQTLLAEYGLGHAETFFARTDGTVMAADYAATHPLLLYGGVDAATARGAVRLAGNIDALVALAHPDGAPRSVCAVTAGLPRLTSGHTVVVGVPTTLRVIALVPARLSGDVGEADQATIDALTVAEAVDRAKDAPGDLPLLLAGPGAEALSATLPSRLAGTVGVRCPAWAHAAAAVGVATAPVSGEAERIVTVSGENSEEVRQAVREAARATAVRAGADPRQVAVTTVDESPIAYLADPAVLLRVRAEGPPRSDVAIGARAGGGEQWRPRSVVAPLGRRDGN